MYNIQLPPGLHGHGGHAAYGAHGAHGGRGGLGGHGGYGGHGGQGGQSGHGKDRIQVEDRQGTDRTDLPTLIVVYQNRSFFPNVPDVLTISFHKTSSSAK